MCVTARKSYTNHRFSNLEPRIKKKFNLHLDSHFVFCSYEGECRGHFNFVSFQFTRQQRLFRKLLQINHITVNILTATVNV